jgi:hypothetical protein
MARSALAAAATLVALAFAMATYERWLDRRARHDLAWSAALLMFALGSGCLLLGAARGWNEWTFRLFYLFGAILNVPFLALGTVYLHADRRAADACGAVVCLVSAFACGVLMVAPLNGPVPAQELPRGSDVFGPLPRALAALCSSAGAAVVIGGAAVSAWRFRRGRMLLANLLIAGGTLVSGASGLLNSVLGEMDAFAVTLVVGITLIFVGFVVATAARPPALVQVRGSPPTRIPSASQARRAP